MAATQDFPERVAAAQATVAEAVDHAAIELAAIDLFGLFEARMQHHFRRGPFSRKLKALLLENGHADLADRVYQYYLVVNVLKHGKGASYRELVAISDPVFVMQTDEDAQTGLVDVSVPGFFDGLTATILEAYHFLEAKQA